MDMEFSCDCGKARWRVGDVSPRSALHLVCHCRDCQAFAHYLGHANDVLDDAGGTAVIQVSPSRVTILQGAEHIAPIKLGPRGLLRWRTTCCGSAVANTPANARIAYAGLILRSDSDTDGLGPIIARVNTGTATKTVAGFGLGRAILRGGLRLLAERLGGGWKRSPFFRAGSSTPIAAPLLISREDKARAYAAVDAAATKAG